VRADERLGYAGGPTRRPGSEVPARADDPIWTQLADTALATDQRRWRRVHPDATLTKIEQALYARLAPVRVALLAEVAGDAPNVDERCPGCGERLVRRGRRTRMLRTLGGRPGPPDPLLSRLPGLRRWASPLMSASGCCPAAL
jgi:predicted RNA-binding Zn-ribbon protein involved in translation (DUF1610 family)